VRRALALVACAVAGVLAGCSSGTDKEKPSATLPTPQPTTNHETGTPSTPSNTNRTTTEAGNE
jgi:ABC-type Fe3+-hydroxamate transport system substrate-binding protein